MAASWMSYEMLCLKGLHLMLQDVHELAQRLQGGQLDVGRAQRIVQHRAQRVHQRGQRAAVRVSAGEEAVEQLVLQLAHLRARHRASCSDGCTLVRGDLERHAQAAKAVRKLQQLPSTLHKSEAW